MEAISKGLVSTSIGVVYEIVCSHMVLDLLFDDKKLNGFVSPSGVLILFDQGGHLMTSRELMKKGKGKEVNGYVVISHNDLLPHQSMSNEQIETCRVVSMKLDMYKSE